MNPIRRRQMGVNKPGYQLYDAFLDTLAAGAVNGTLATPPRTVKAVGATRTVTDTEGKLSVAGGVLTFAGGKASPAWGDPRLDYGSVIVRTAGIVCIGNVIISTTVSDMMVGFSSLNNNHLNNGHGVYLRLGSLRLWANGSSLTVGAYTDGITYQFCVVLRTAGAYLFIRGGVFTSWTLMAISGVGTATPLWPAIINYDNVMQADNIRIPDRLYIPTPLAYDTFTRADGSLGSSEAVGPDGQSVPQLAWTGSTWAISSGKAVNTPTMGAELNSGTLTVGAWYVITATEVDYFYTGSAIGQTFRATAATALDANNKVKALTLATLFATHAYTTTNILADITLAAYTTGPEAGMVLRLDSAASPANFIIAYQDSGNVKIDECVAGVYTNLGTYASAYASGDSLRVSLDGNAWRLYKITSAGVATLLGSGTTAVTTDTLTTPTGEYPGDDAYVGGVLLPDGRVFCVPRSATSARIYNPTTDTLTTPTGEYPGSRAYFGGVLLPDGRVFCVPRNATSARIYDPTTDTLTTPTGTYPGGDAYVGGVLLPDGRVFCVPLLATSARIYDPTTDTLTTPSDTYPGGGAYYGGVLLPDGRVFCVPLNATSARIYNPTTDTLTTPSGTYSGSSAYSGGVLLPDGRVFCVPLNATSARIYDPTTDTQLGLFSTDSGNTLDGWQCWARGNEGQYEGLSAL